jgi:hypothetical protein
VEFSTANHAELNLITVLSLLVMVLKANKTTTLLETHGVPHGELKDMSTLQLLRVQVSVASKVNQLFQSFEKSMYQSIALTFQKFND